MSPFSKDAAAQRISAFGADPEFPCVGAKSALNKQRMRFAHYEALDDEASVVQLCDDLAAFSSDFPQPGADPVSFVATFDRANLDEAQFEMLMWRHLQRMHDRDQHDYAWDVSVSADPTHNDFSLSIGGRAFFVVGLHAAASRQARRAPMPCLVFNFHEQFEALKDSGKFSSMQTAIRARDTVLQDCVNPVLARYGEASEARQYSGRAVNDDWVCPFRQRSMARA